MLGAKCELLVKLAQRQLFVLGSCGNGIRLRGVAVLLTVKMK